MKALGKQLILSISLRAKKVIPWTVIVIVGDLYSVGQYLAIFVIKICDYFR